MTGGGDHDLIVVGSGAAGLMAACIAAVDRPVALLTDRGIGTSNSAVAQGGLQCPTDRSDSIALFRDDMLRSAGDVPIDPARVEHFVGEAGPTIELLRSWGLECDLGPDGSPLRLVAGGMSEARLITAAGRIGSAILKVLRRRAAEVGVEIRTRMPVVDLGRDGERLVVVTEHATTRATAVILAVGGTAYERAIATGRPTSNPVNRNSVLYEAIRRLGVVETDPDRFQYQPYGIVTPSGRETGRCVPESVSGLGASVVDRDGTPIVAPTANREEIYRAMTDQRERAVRAGDTTCYVLTLGELDRDELLARYPHLRRSFDKHGLPSGDVLVAPVLHYQLGGFAVGPDCSTSVPGLYLAGEVTGGLHGANRLMGNGITEAVVDGRSAAIAAGCYIDEMRFRNWTSGQ